MSKDKNKVEIQVQRFAPMENPADSSILKKHLDKADSQEPFVATARIISRADYPIEVGYGDSVIRLSPRQRADVADENLIKKDGLDPLITVVKI